MNRWKVRLSVNKRTQARREIGMLLNTCHLRRTKPRKRFLSSQSQFGTFSKSLSFKVTREEAYEPSLQPDGESETNSLPVGRGIRSKKNKQRSIKNQKSKAIDILKENRDQAKVQSVNKEIPPQVQPSNGVQEKPQTKKPKSTTCLNVLNEKNHRAPSRCNTIAREHQENLIPEVNAVGDDEAVIHDTFTDIFFGNIANDVVQHEMLSFDSLIDPSTPNHSDGSTNSTAFNKIGSQTVANECSSLDCFFGSTTNNNSILSDFCSNCSSNNSGNVPSDDEPLSTPTKSHQQVNHPGIPSTIRKNLTESEICSFNPFVGECSPKIKNLPQITLSMVISWKQIAAGRSYNRLFGANES